MDFRDVFSKSFDRTCSANIGGKTFLQEFYNRFPQSHPEITRKFKDTDFEKLTKLIFSSIRIMVKFSEDLCDNEEIRFVAAIHQRENYNVAPYLYQHWLSSLVTVVSEFDPQYDENVALAWKLAMAPGITYLSHFYRPHYETCNQSYNKKPLDSSIPGQGVSEN